MKSLVGTQKPHIPGSLYVSKARIIDEYVIFVLYHSAFGPLSWLSVLSLVEGCLENLT